jgi:hypothetical protein
MPPAGLKLLHPLKSTAYPITQHFGENPQWYPLTNGHNGIDFGIPLRTSIYATLPGKVIRVAADPNGYGNHIRIQHDNNLLSLYGHLDERNWHNVQEGQDVVAGWEIGFSGNTGRSTGPHLHYEVREGTQAFDPESYLTLNIGPGPIPEPARPIFRVRVTADPSLNIRSGPSVVYPAIGQLATGDEIEALELGGTEVWLRTSKGYIAFRYNGYNLVEVVEE